MRCCVEVGPPTLSAVSDQDPHVQASDLIDTGQVWLRRARLTDAPALFASYASDPDATRYLSWAPRRSIGEVEAWLAPRISGWKDGEEYRWVIVDHPDGNAFGTASLRTTESGYDLGYALATSRTGRGLATTVVHHLLAWIDTHPTPTVVTASTDPDNTASARVLTRCGFQLVRREIAVAHRPGTGDELRDSLVFERRSA